MLYPHIFRRARLGLYCKTLTDESPPFDLKRWHFEVIYNALHSFRLKFLFFKGRISYHSSNKGHLWRNYMLYLIYICYASFLRILQYGTNHVTRSVSDESRHVMKYLCLRKFMVILVCYSQTGMRRCSFLMYQLHIYYVAFLLEESVADRRRCNIRCPQIIFLTNRRHPIFLSHS